MSQTTTRKKTSGNTKNFGIYCLGVITGIVISSISHSAAYLQTILKEVHLANGRQYQQGEEAPCQQLTTPPPYEDVKNIPLSWSSKTSSLSQRQQQEVSALEQAAEHAFRFYMMSALQPKRLESQPRCQFDKAAWERHETNGGLQDLDRVTLTKYYSTANSVFEFGLGESTYLAHHVGVPRYAGMDSDPHWVSMARDHVSDRFRFYMADVGPTKAWGYPDHRTSKQVFQYQLSILLAEPLPFDVYMVDGRFRFPCLLISFLHASARGAPHNHTTVLLHDCLTHAVNDTRRNYHQADDELLDLVDHSGDRLCVYKRKPHTTDAQILDLWKTYKRDHHR